MARLHDKSLFFCAGLPRSGSTLLCNILAQNESFHVTATSGIVDVLRVIRDMFDRNPSFKAMPNEERTTVKLDTAAGALSGYFTNNTEPVCIDKSRGWPGLLEFMSSVFGDRDSIKLLVTVRDVRDVLASFEKLYRITSAQHPAPLETIDGKPSTALARAYALMEPGRVVGSSLIGIKDAVTRGWASNMLFVDYDLLTTRTEYVLRDIYSHFGLPYYGQHNFVKVEQRTEEDDSVHGYLGLHKIRSTIERQPPQWPQVYDKQVVESPFWEMVEHEARFWEQLENIKIAGVQ